jgi:hypothetical protein
MSVHFSGLHAGKLHVKWWFGRAYRHIMLKMSMRILNKFEMPTAMHRRIHSTPVLYEDC